MKYYTPSIEDIRVGYECEIWWNYNYLPNNQWCLIDAFQGGTQDFDMFDFSERIEKNEIRTSYLTKEQIEAEGWEAKEARRWNSNSPHFYYEKGNYISLILKDRRLAIIMKDVTLDDYTCNTSNGQVYLGQCRCINDFKLIQKLLCIDK